MNSEELQVLSRVILRLQVDASELRSVGLEGYAEDLEKILEELEEVEAEKS